MYPTFSRAAEFSAHLPSAPPMHSISPPPFHLTPDQLAVNEFDSLLNSDLSHNNNSCSSGCSSYGSPSSLASYGTHRRRLMQRSVSSHSLHKNEVHHSVSALFADFLDSDNGPVRRVYSTGDLQRIKVMQLSSNHQSDSSLSSESSMIIEGMSRTSRYSPEEKKMRIERYRSKRNQRNFNKKIKYVCRKTLADSRPRVRGRFARNEETEKSPAIEWRHNNGVAEEEYEEDENWVNFFENLATENLAQDSSSSFWSNMI